MNTVSVGQTTKWTKPENHVIWNKAKIDPGPDRISRKTEPKCSGDLTNDQKIADDSVRDNPCNNQGKSEQSNF